MTPISLMGFTLFPICHTLAQNSGPLPPSVSSVVNLASGQNVLAPGALAAIFGSNLSLQQPSTVPVSVYLNSIQAAVLTVTPQQLTVELPVESQPGSGLLQVQNQGLSSSLYTISLGAYAPGIFTASGNVGSIWHADGSAVTLTSPAQPGEAVSVLCMYGTRTH
jgi:uncharacterized protein (TIGR03437 family)